MCVCVCVYNLCVRVYNVCVCVYNVYVCAEKGRYIDRETYSERKRLREKKERDRDIYR